MKGPEKIYVTPVRTWDTKHIPDLQDNIYISKDALIEWLENKINISDGGFVNGLIYLAYKDVIEHLKKM